MEQMYPIGDYKLIKPKLKLLTSIVFPVLINFLIVEPTRFYLFENILLPFISKYSSYLFRLIDVTIEHQSIIISYLKVYKFVDVITPFGTVFWIPFLFLLTLKMKKLNKKFINYHILAFAALYPIGFISLNNFDALYFVFNLFQVIMIFMSLTFYLLGIKQLVNLNV